MAARLIPAVLAIAAIGCAALGNFRYVLQPPRFEEARDRPGEVAAESIARHAGGRRSGAALDRGDESQFVRVSTATLQVRLTREGSQAATGEFPLGLPLEPRESTVIPLDLRISFADLPGLSTAITRAARGQAIAYQVDGTIGADAGRFGTPTFGPMRLFEGEFGR